MFAIFKRELRSYFTSLVGYVVIGVMLAFTGLYYSANCLVYGTSDFSTVLYSTTLVMLFLLPALTMRSFADERRNKTDQLLLTSPVGIPSIVMGKYFAQLAVFAVPMAAAAIMPLVLTAFGTISLTSAYATWLAYFLMGAACIAIGTFVSALTENQIIAYLATFGALLICYLMNGIKSLFTSGNTLAFIVFCVVLAVVALLVGLACKNVTVGSAVFCGGAVVLVLLFAKSFGGLKIGYLKRTDMFYSQTLSIFCVNVVTYFQISVVNRDFSATVPMVLLTIVDLAVLILWIVLTNKLYFRLYPPRKLVVIYGDRNAAELVLKMSRRVDKYMICESVSASAPPEEIREAISRYEGIILCEVSGRLRNDLIKYCFAQNVRAYIAPKISDIILRGAEEIRLFDTPLLLCRNYGLTFEQKLGKRIFDLVFAVVFLVILSPVMLASAIAIKLDDGGPVLFKQKRLTYHGKEFYVYKFRSMVVDAEKSGPQLAKENDSRITKVGRILRKCRLDELPQLINILRGDMSVVGPRPERPELAEEYEKTMPEFEFRLQVKAGLTGYAQVTGLYDTLPYDKLKMDLMYIENYSIFMDLRIILMTLKTALFPGETNEEANAHDAQELLYQEEQIQEQEKEKGDHS